MLKDFLARWGFVIAGILFFVAGVMPLAEGQPFKAGAFTIGIVFLANGAAIARRRRVATRPKR